MEKGSAGVKSPWILLLLRIGVAILVLGQGAFVGMLLMFDFGPDGGEPFFGDFLTFSAAVVAFLAIAINAALAIALRRSMKRGNERGLTWLAVRTLGGAVAFQFAGFFCAAAMMLEQSWGAAILTAAMLLGTASRFPVRP